MKNCILLTLLILLNLGIVSELYAQSTHPIEPSILEVRYNIVQGKNRDVYALRCGKNVSQYFSIYNLRTDSLSASPDPVISRIPFNELCEAIEHRDDPSKQLPTSPGHIDYLYRNLNKNKISVYTRVFGSKYLVEEDVPEMNWIIDEDSVQTVLGYECHKATTKFRGREWIVWYADAIPMSLGPWKLNGLPGLILQAECYGYIKITANSIMTSNLSPVTFYNFSDYKYEPLERVKYIKTKTNPKSYPPRTTILPLMELE